MLCVPTKSAKSAMSAKCAKSVRSSAVSCSTLVSWNNHKYYSDDFSDIDEYRQLSIYDLPENGGWICSLTNNDIALCYTRNIHYDSSVFSKHRYELHESTSHQKIGIVVIATIDSTDFILLVQDYGVSISIPKGSVDKSDESCVDTAIRELDEETGIFIHDKSRFHHYKTNCFQIKLNSNEVDLSQYHIDGVDIEITKIFWYPLKKISLITPFLNHFSSSILNSGFNSNINSNKPFNQ